MPYLNINPDDVNNAKELLVKEFSEKKSSTKSFIELIQPEQDALEDFAQPHIGEDKLEFNGRPVSAKKPNDVYYCEDHYHDYNMNLMTGTHHAAVAPTSVTNLKNLLDNTVFHKDENFQIRTFIVIGPNEELQFDKLTGFAIYKDAEKNTYVRLPDGNYVSTEYTDKLIATTDYQNLDPAIKKFAEKDLTGLAPATTLRWLNYWSRDINNSQFKLTLIAKAKLSTHIYRYELSASDGKTQTKMVVYHLPDWQDFSTLELNSDDIAALFNIYQLDKYPLCQRTVTHCQMGRGRTNTVLFAIDLFINRRLIFLGADAKTLHQHFKARLLRFRQLRPGAVQTDKQLCQAIDLSIAFNKVIAQRMEKPVTQDNMHMLSEEKILQQANILFDEFHTHNDFVSNFLAKFITEENKINAISYFELHHKYNFKQINFIRKLIKPPEITQLSTPFHNTTAIEAEELINLLTDIASCRENIYVLLKQMLEQYKFASSGLMHSSVIDKAIVAAKQFYLFPSLIYDFTDKYNTILQQESIKTLEEALKLLVDHLTKELTVIIKKTNVL